MLVCKTLAVLFFLCSVHNCISKPAAGPDVTEGRGVMTSIWGWITYPFYWWSSSETEPPMTGQLLGTSTNNPNDIVDIRRHNVSVWCNDQTCTTMKCDKTQCRNITCNIYDTDYSGECREYNIKSDPDKLKVTEIILPNTTETPKEIIPSKPTETYNVTSSVNKTQVMDTTPAAEEHPLELEAVLSSTVNKLDVEKHSENKEDPTSHKIEV